MDLASSLPFASWTCLVMRHVLARLYLVHVRQRPLLSHISYRVRATTRSDHKESGAGTVDANMEKGRDRIQGWNSGPSVEERFRLQYERQQPSILAYFFRQHPTDEARGCIRRLVTGVVVTVEGSRPWQGWSTSGNHRRVLTTQTVTLDLAGGADGLGGTVVTPVTPDEVARSGAVTYSATGRSTRLRLRSGTHLRFRMRSRCRCREEPS